MNEGLIVDLFAGGGGASMGIEAALGRDVDIAINHDPVAIAVHKANHPNTEHYATDIWEVKPLDATRGRPVLLLHASPDCKHFSRAKGGRPKSQKVRSLAWVVRRWANDVKPAVITLENVAEFQDWGPLYPPMTWRHADGRVFTCTSEASQRSFLAGKKVGKTAWRDVSDAPIPERKGETFRRWKRDLEKLGYVVEHRLLHAHHYGAPTSRKRLFLVARRDGGAIRWPERTHGPGLLPYKTAAQCIDWSLRCPSIFERKKPLAKKTLARIAAGIRRFVLENPDPFVVTIDHQSAASAEQLVGQPLSTVTTKARHVLVTPTIVPVNHGGGESRAERADEPLTTVTAARRGHAVVAAFVAGCGGRAGQSQPTGGDEPVGTITAKNDRVVVAPTLIQTSYGERAGQAPRVLDLHQPLGTVVAQGQKHSVAAAFLAKHFGGVVGKPLGKAPLDTITAVDHHSLVTSHLEVMRNNASGKPLDGPVPTICANGNHVAEVRTFLTTYYGSEKDVGQVMTEPLRTVVTKDRFGLVTVAGVEYEITDIGMRMLEPHELDRAQFGRFAKGYRPNAAKTKKDRVRLTGNSVCPEVEEALVAALFPGRRARAAA